MQTLPTKTAGICPDDFTDDLIFGRRRIVIAVLIILIALGFGLRICHLATESLSEDELNKLETVQDYRQHGLSSRNGEHPFLMKGLQTLSVTTAGSLNERFGTSIPDEAALRFPVALLGTLTILFLYLFAAELFGRSIGLVAAALWAFEPIAVGFDRIAKEDSLVVCFFLLSQYFWLRSQSGAERQEPGWIRYVWFSAIGFGAMMASKYYPFLLAITAGYYNIFQAIPSARWRLGRTRWFTFLCLIGVAFVILNPTILLPETWREMLKFSSEGRIAHDSYEYLGVLYPNKLTLWFRGVPWTFYIVYFVTKTSILTLAAFVIGLPLAIRRRAGDGRLYLITWTLLWFVPFSVLGGKFTRYFAIGEPLVIIAAAFGFVGVARLLSSMVANAAARYAVQATLIFLIIAVPFYDSAVSEPYLRLFGNVIAERWVPPGSGFPHDEFYDTATRQIAEFVVANAGSERIVATETPTLFDFYARRAGRTDLRSNSLSDPQSVQSMQAGDIIVLAQGRRYFSNRDYFAYLESSVVPAAEISVDGIIAARVYQLDDASAAAVHEIAKAHS